LNGGLPLGKGPGASWKKERFRTPYLRDFMLDQGVAIDTMETAFEWSQLEDGHLRVLDAMRAATKRHAGGGLAMGHVSHSYPDGACVYSRRGLPGETERRARAGARSSGPSPTPSSMPAERFPITTASAPTTRPGWRARKGPSAWRPLKALKHADPEGIMNPGSSFEPELDARRPRASAGNVPRSTSPSSSSSGRHHRRGAFSAMHTLRGIASLLLERGDFAGGVERDFEDDPWRAALHRRGPARRHPRIVRGTGLDGAAQSGISSRRFLSCSALSTTASRPGR
jgi:hypothetical protein